MRGRGRGRGGGRRGGGGRGRGRGFPRSGSVDRGSADTVSTPDIKDLDINDDLRAFFVESVSIEQHLKGQTANRDRYAAGMAALQKSSVEVPQSKFLLICFTCNCAGIFHK